MQISRSVSPTETFSGWVYGPRWVIILVATRVEMTTDCQNEKKRIPFTQRNLGTGLCCVRCRS